LYGKEQIDYHQLVWAGRAPGVFPMQDRRLWERAFEASINGAMRVEEAVGSKIAAMAIARPDLAAELGMGSVRQNKRLCK
jgi:hypothetical protein